MTEQITSAEIAKAAHNLARLAEFVGVRRGWTVAEAGLLPAKKARMAGEAIGGVISGITGGEIATPIGVEQPAALEPAGEISTDRLVRFADYLGQLRRWFEARSGSQLPPGSEGDARSIQRSLAATDEALRQLLDEQPPEPEPELKEEVVIGPPPLTRPDLGNVVEVDPNARLVLDHTWQKSLLQKRGNIMELTPETVKKLDTFFVEQGLELTTHERRRLYEKVQRWIESTPNQRVLVLRMSGLSGKPDVVSSFQPREEEDEAPVAPRSMYGPAPAKIPDDKDPSDEPEAVAPKVVPPPVAKTPMVEDAENESVEDVFRLDDD
jgi:hypothetical protein